jgi:methionyl-tRNA formyltransferase
MWEWPRGWTTLRGETVQIHRAHIETGSASEVPGTVEVRHGEPSIATGAGRLIIDIAQIAGSKPLAGPAWLQQSRAVGEMLGTKGAPEKPTLPMVRAVLA